MLGQRAECPHCKSHFRAPIRNEQGELTEPLLLRRNPFANRRVLPGMALLLVGLIGFLSNGLQAVKAYVDPRTFEDQTRDFFNHAAESTKSPEVRDKIPLTLKWLPRVRIALAFLSLITIAGGWSLLRARRHGMAMFGSILAMMNIANCCCFGNVLVGAWAIYTLLNPEVRAQFQAHAQTHPAT